jgi:uncharacterized protein YqhQ
LSKKEAIPRFLFLWYSEELPVATINYGGQAVIEGVMMRGRKMVAVAVRKPDGTILLHKELLTPRLYQNRLLSLPFLRGLLLLWEMLVLGTRMMAFATGVASGEITEENQKTTVGKGMLAVTITTSLAFVVVLFFLGPLALVGTLQRQIGNTALALLLEGGIRLAILIGYLWLISQLRGVQRVFGYHGAEHKAINTFEQKQPLDVAHVRLASKVHTRCGTGFLLIVMVISIFVFALVGNPPLVFRILSRIVLIPVVAAIAYEAMRLGASYYRFRIVRWLLAPSLALQGLTTREPDDAQIECAIRALEQVLEQDGVRIPERTAT